jgi:hypothetical protein
VRWDKGTRQGTIKFGHVPFPVPWIFIGRIFWINSDPTIENDRRFAFVQDQFVEPAVHAVYSYANALKRAHADKCGGMTGMCALLKSMTTEDFYLNYLSKTDFKYSKKERVESLASAQLDPYHAPAKVKFDTNGDITDYSFEIYSFNDYTT